MEISKHFGLKNMIVIITGSGKGNGLQMAKDFSSMGAKVYRLDVSMKKILKKNIYDYLVDINNYDEVDKVINAIYFKNKKIDVLINNAGITLESLDFKKIRLTIETNLLSALNLSYKVAEIMKKNNDGSIINITSLGSHLGFSNNPAYQISKSGLSQLTRAVAKDFGEYGIRCNSICPGYIKTDMTKKSYNDKIRKNFFKNRTMLKRWGQSKDLTGACIFLASKMSSYITASEIFVDGGWSKNSF